MSVEKEYIVMHKASVAVSFIEDVFSFGGFMAVLYFNHRYLSGNGWIDFLFILLWISTMTAIQSRRYHKFKTEDEAIKYLQGIS